MQTRFSKDIHAKTLHISNLIFAVHNSVLHVAQNFFL